jgi:hypothetical protein
MNDARQNKKFAIYDGENNGRAIMSTKEVIAIREFYKNNNFTYKDIAKIYNVNVIVIAKIVRRETWKHI